MLKGSLVVGTNQSVALHADSLRGLIELANSKAPVTAPEQMQNPIKLNSEQGIRLRVDLIGSDLSLSALLADE